VCKVGQTLSPTPPGNEMNEEYIVIKVRM